MSLVTTLWSMQAAAALTLAVLYGLVWSIDRRNLANLTLCIVAVAMAVAARDEVRMMHAATTTEYGEWTRLIYLPLFFALVGQMFFVHLFLGTGRVWLLSIIVGARVVVLAGNFLTHPTFAWREIVGLRQVTFLGEQVSIAGPIVLRSWHWLSLASYLLIIVFIADAALRAWRRGGAEGRRKALVIAAGVGIPLTLTAVYSQAVLLGALPLPFLVTPSFLITIVVMAVELSRGFILNRQTRQELEELRAELARAGRVTALGQLASALAHELSQPLSAILRNAEAAELHLNGPHPDLDELRAIVTDIRKDDQRAGDVIEQMRSLIKRRTLQMHPLALNEVVEDVISLVHSDALARHVALDYVMTPGLPLVSGDRVHLSQVLLNLIINGMDATQASPAYNKRVVIEARPREEGRVEVAVTDSGPGLPAAAIAKVFDPFYTTKSGGLGMGLPISRTIIEAHGGRLWAERAPQGSGLTFRFTLAQAQGAVS
ncbi:MAG TPA: ATP-binding protein [Steroidobacteraceae bacterium]|jgi:signal transduction histidine kinase|nr:ATP-binding protein [Steroidobacteraceae bacterium]